MLAIPFYGLIYQSIESLDNATDKISVLYDSKPIFSKGFNFDVTDYYESEFGKNLKRTWCAYKEKIEASNILQLKLKTIEFEQDLTEDKKRTVNIDPGIVQLNRVVLATHKDAAHRIYLGNGIFAELALIYKDKTFTPLDWTYPDYRWPQTIEFFNSLRNWLKESVDV